MRRAHQVPKSLRRMASLTLVLATVLALANLPADNLPLPWLLAFTLPGAVLGSWSRLARAPWQRALLAVILQATACYAALETVGPMTRPAALACTILPPLAFATTRNHDGDPSLALFLGFCVMLVGVILGGIDLPLSMGSGAAALCEDEMASSRLIEARVVPAAVTMIEQHERCDGGGRREAAVKGTLAPRVIGRADGARPEPRLGRVARAHVRRRAHPRELRQLDVRGRRRRRARALWQRALFFRCGARRGNSSTGVERQY